MKKALELSWALLCVALTACTAHATEVKLVTAPLVSPSAAWGIYGSSPTHTAGVAARPTRPIEIIELARALGAQRYTNSDYAQNVYQYVRNNIAIEFRFGLAKGARGAVIDQSGTAFDQAQLMVELLRQGNVSASYRVGTITLTGAQFLAWTGLSDAVAACQFLADGGIPALVNGASSCGGLTGSVSSVEMGHIWVEANSSSYDPAFKVHLGRTPLVDLASALGCGTSSASTCGSTIQGIVNSAVTVNGSTTSALNVNQAGIESQLLAYATNLQVWIDNYNATNSANVQMEDLLGGRIIDIGAPLGTSFPYPSSPQYTWTGDIPDQFRTTLQVQLLDINQTLYVDEIYGDRLRMWSKFAFLPNPNDGAMRTTALYLEYRLLAVSSPIQVPPGRFYSSFPAPARTFDALTLRVNHPYGANSGTYLDETLVQQVLAVLDLTMIDSQANRLGDCQDNLCGNVITIVHGWGEARESTIAHFAALQRRDETNVSIENPADTRHIIPQYNPYPWNGPICDPLSLAGRPTSTSGGITTTTIGDPGCLEQGQGALAANWLAQASRAMKTIGHVNGLEVHHHHTLGSLVSGRTSGVAGIFNVDASISIDAANGQATARTAAFRTTAALMDRLEGGVLEQNYEMWDGGSAVSTLVRSNSKGTRLYNVDQGNVNALVPNSLSGYPTAITQRIRDYVTAGYSVMVPQAYILGQFAFGPNLITFQKNAIIATGDGGDRIAYLTGDNQKGAAGDAAVYDAASGVMATTQTLEYSTKSKKFYGVGLQDNSLTLTPPPDLVTGAGEFPYSLVMQRYYASHDLAGFSSQSTLQQISNHAYGGSLKSSFQDPSAVGSGWTHALAIGLTMGSDPFIALGRDGALNAVRSIAGIYTLFNLNASSSNFQSSLASVYVANWVGSSLNSNVVTVRRPPNTTTFARRADGINFNPPPGSAEKLIQTNARVIDSWWYYPTGLPHWRGDNVTFALTDKEGATLQFGFAFVNTNGGVINGQPVWSNSGNLWIPTQWVFPTGVSLTFEYLSAASSMPGMAVKCLRRVSNNLGRWLEFTSQYPSENCGLNEWGSGIGLGSVADESGRMVQYQKSPINISGQYWPDALPESLSVTTPDGGVTKYVYAQNPMGPVARSYSAIVGWLTPTDQANPFLTVTYDGLSRVKTAINNASPPSTTEYFSTGLYGSENQKRGEIRDPLSALTTQYFDKNGLLVGNIDPLNRSTYYAYDSARRLAKVTKPEGDATSYSYDARHNRLTETRAAKPGSALASWTTTYTYVEGPTTWSCVTPATCNKVATVQDARGNTTTSSYASNGQLTRTVGAASLSPRTHYCYASFTASGQTGAVSLLTGKIESVSSTEERVSDYTYNPANKLVLQSTTIDPSTTLALPASATNPTCSTTAKGSALALTTTYSFDSKGDLSSTDGPRAGTSDVMNYTFDSMRRLRRVGTAAGASAPQITLRKYDLDGLLTSTHRARVATPDENAPFNAAEWAVQIRSYYPTGDLLSVTDEENHSTIYGYDAVGRQRVVQDAEGRQNAKVYDAAGQVIAEWRGGANWLTGSGTSTAVSASAPTASTSWIPANYTNGALRYAAYTYSPNGKQLSVQDANDNVTEFQYDRHDRLWYTFFPDPSTGTRCAQHTSENTSSSTSPAPTCTGEQRYEKLWYTSDGLTTGSLCSGVFDSACRKRTRANQEITSTYDVLNRLRTKQTTGQGTVTYTYNLTNEPTSVSKASTTTYAAQQTSYTYDSAGRKLTETDVPTGRTMSFQYDTLVSAGDNAGQRTRTTWPDGYFVTYAYDSLNRMQYVRENSTSANELAYYSYDPLSRRTHLCFGGSSPTCTTTASNKIGYSYEPDSNLDVLTHRLNATTVSLDYGHNNAGQINSIVASDAFYLPTHATGTTPYVSNRLNQYASVDAQASTYDANGNLLTWFPVGGQHTYTYDSENRLRTAAVNGSTTPTITYDYDALGRRISKVVDGTATTYLLDGDEEVAEYDGAGALLRRYITGPAIDDRIARVEGSTLGNPTKYYYHVNHQGSVIDMTDSAGTIAQQLAYDEYGNLTSQQPPAAATGELFRYTGRRFDLETGLYYYRARYYSPVLGRFLQTDPIGYEDDLNLYAYVGNDPLNAADPRGSTKLIISGLKIARKTFKNGGDFRGALKTEVTDTIENLATLLDGKVDINDVLAIVDLATGIDAGDVKSGVKAAEKLRDKFADAVGKDAPTVTAGFNTKTGAIATGRSNSCGDCAEDAVRDALGGNKDDVVFTKAIRPRKSEEVPVCEKCEANYGREAFPEDARFRSDEADRQPLLP